MSGAVGATSMIPTGSVLPGTPRATLATYVTEDGIDVATPTQNQDLHR